MRKNILFLLMLISALSNAQFCKEPLSINSNNYQNLNFDFLQTHKVKCLRITYASKEDGQRIKDVGLAEKIYLDTLGNPTQKLRTNKSDTSETFYYYQNGRLTIVRDFHSGEIATSYFTYDSLQNKIKEVHCKEENAGDNKTFFKLKKQLVEWSETYTYQQLSDKQLHRKSFNDNGALYKEAILYRNEKGLLLEENERYTVTGVSQSFKYTYNNEGNLQERLFRTDVVGELEEKSTFTYDTKGNISGELFFRNGKLQFEKIYFYDSKNEFLQSILTKFPDRNTIELQNFLIEFF